MSEKKLSIKRRIDVMLYTVVEDQEGEGPPVATEVSFIASSRIISPLLREELEPMKERFREERHGLRGQFPLSTRLNELTGKEREDFFAENYFAVQDQTEALIEARKDLDLKEARHFAAFIVDPEHRNLTQEQRDLLASDPDGDFWRSQDPDLLEEFVSTFRNRIRA